MKQQHQIFQVLKAELREMYQIRRIFIIRCTKNTIIAPNGHVKRIRILNEDTVGRKALSVSHEPTSTHSVKKSVEVIGREAKH